MSTRRSRGFTLVEMMVVVAIIGVLAALASFAMTRDRPRATLQSISSEVHALLRNARLNALSTGRPTIVLFFPNYANPLDGVGRILVVEDTAGTFFSATAAVNLGNFNPASVQMGASDEIVLSLDLPRNVRVGLPLPASGRLAALALPYSRVNVATACGFCGTLADGRGAIRFDARGRATFHGGVGAPMDTWGESFSLANLDPGGVAVTPGGRTFVVTSTTGSVKTFLSGG